jgi:hypothetical protein
MHVAMGQEDWHQLRKSQRIEAPEVAKSAANPHSESATQLIAAGHLYQLSGISMGKIFIDSL